VTKGNLIGVCGIYCGACLIYRAYKDNDQKLIHYLEENGLSKELIRCEGCISGDVSPTCAQCKFRDCAKQKGLTYCFECKDMPCSMIVELAEKRSKADNLPHLTLCPANLQSLKHNNAQEWLKQQERRWKCSLCGKKMHWYSKSCPDCGTEFFDAMKEARSLGKLQDWPQSVRSLVEDK
jgi:Protein of unknown function (DUF3795)